MSPFRALILRSLTLRSLISVVVVLGIASLPGRAESERITALVTVANANVRCLIATGTMKPDQAMRIANRFLDAEDISRDARRAVNNEPGFNDLVNRYIRDRGGCQTLIQDLQ